MTCTHLRRILALEEKFPPPMPDWDHLNIDELHHLKMLFVKQLVARHHSSISHAPSPLWIVEALQCETPKQRAATRREAGLKRGLPGPNGTPRSAPGHRHPRPVDRELDAHAGNQSNLAGARVRSLGVTTIAGGPCGGRGKPRPRRASLG